MSPAVPTHFHLGLGNLGLGLVIPLFAGKTRLYGLIRGASSDKRYDVLERTKRFRRDVEPSGDRTSEWFEIAGTARYGVNGLLDAAATLGPPDIVTCAIKNDIASVYPLLATLIETYRDRYRAAPLLFLPFENARDVGRGALEYVAAHVPDGDSCILAADSIVDKVCSNTRVESDGCVVTTEPGEQLLFSGVRAQDTEALQTELGRLHLDRHVYARPRFELEIRKKTWLVNGLHYCIAICAYDLDLPVLTIQEALRDPQVAATAAQFALEMLVALHGWARAQSVTVDESALLAYADTVWTRMHSPPDDPKARILPAVSHMLHEMNVGPRAGRPFSGFPDFFRKWRERVSEPAALILEHHALLDGRLVSPSLDGMLVKILGDFVSAGVLPGP